MGGIKKPRVKKKKKEAKGGAGIASTKSSVTGTDIGKSKAWVKDGKTL